MIRMSDYLNEINTYRNNSENANNLNNKICDIFKHYITEI
jgi:hypothetical protein